MRERGLNGFDAIAGIYDRLAGLVYGKSIVQAQLYFLDRVPPKARVLIVGGGTGWLLKALLLKCPDCTVWYVEASEQMQIATQRNVAGLAERVHFIHGTEQAIPAGLQVDVVITHFYLDLFAENSLPDIVEHLLSFLRSRGLWLVADFVYRGRWWQALLLRTMFFFFRITSGIESKQLADWHTVLLNGGLQENGSEFFFKGFIRSAIYRSDKRAQ